MNFERRIENTAEAAVFAVSLMCGGNALARESLNATKSIEATQEQEAIKDSPEALEAQEHLREAIRNLTDDELRVAGAEGNFDKIRSGAQDVAWLLWRGPKSGAGDIARDRPRARYDMLKKGIEYVYTEKDGIPIADYPRQMQERDASLIAHNLTKHTGIPMFISSSGSENNCVIEFFSRSVTANAIRSYGSVPLTSRDTYPAHLILSVVPIGTMKPLSIEKTHSGTGREEEWRGIARSYGIHIAGEHELGHSQGLGHATGVQDIMAPQVKIKMAFERDLPNIPPGAMRYTDSAGEKLVLYSDLFGDISKNKSRYRLRCLRALALAGRLEEALEGK